MSALVLPSPLHQQHRAMSLLLLLSSLTLVLLSTFTSALASSLPAKAFSSPRQAASLQGSPIKSSLCKHAGVTKNADGSYHFSWLHVDPATGYIMDENDCIVDLRGFNTAGTEFYDGVGGFPGLTPQRLTWFNSMFSMNFLRLNLNVGWWNTNIYVPNAQMYYRTWIQQWISWAEENGDYVLLTRTNEYTIPPCGGSVTYCPAQAEPSDIDDAQPQQQFNKGLLLNQTVAFWDSITALYKNDPAILYNDWNELHDINAQSWLTVQQTLITTIRAINPRSVIFLGSNDWNNSINPLIDKEVPDLAYPNLVYDWHIYDGKSGTWDGLPCTQGTSYMWAQWGAESNRQFSFAQSHGHGAAIDEWGGCIDDPTYNAALSSYAASHHIAMAYYYAGNVVNASWTALNSNGLLVQAAYSQFNA